MDAFNTLTLSRCHLEGLVKVSGAKNSALRLLAASLLTGGTVTLTNYPAGLLDARIHVEMLEALGKTTSIAGEDAITITERMPRWPTGWRGRGALSATHCLSSAP